MNYAPEVIFQTLDLLVYIICFQHVTLYYPECFQGQGSVGRKETRTFTAKDSLIGRDPKGISPTFLLVFGGPYNTSATHHCHLL